MPTINWSGREEVILRQLVRNADDHGGEVKGVFVPDATDGIVVTPAEFNTLLKSLRDAGLIASRTLKTADGAHIVDDRGRRIALTSGAPALGFLTTHTGARIVSPEGGRIRI